jgi:nucleoside-diphosphate-sugar epimerase
MNILLTGGTGFIGSYLVEKLLENKQFNIILLKRSTSNTYRIDNLLEKVKAYDIDKIKLEDIFKEQQIDGIVHLSTNYIKAHEYEDIDNLINSNITFPTKLVELSIKYGSKFFINTGTFFEYDLNHNPISEKNQINPYNLYASTKISFDNILKYYVQNSSLNVLTLKLSAPFGYNDNPKLVPFLINSVLEDKEVVFEKGEQEWDFIYVRDVVGAYINAIDICINSKRSLYENIVVGTGQKVSVKQVCEIINKLHGKDLIKFEKEYSPNQIFEAVTDNSKAKNILQWVPKYSIEEALKETYKLYKEKKEMN